MKVTQTWAISGYSSSQEWHLSKVCFYQQENHTVNQKGITSLFALIGSESISV